jgi:phosphopantothenoylcysteine decarboxylase/phosphopantothenate--cysteine ligase
MAPAMNQAMWGKAITQDNVKRLAQDGVSFIGPVSGDQACGETGFGRMSEPAEICLRLLTGLGSGLQDTILRGLNVLISAGPTREYLDPVRYITNRSSGKMGYALAQAALQAGAKVTLISGPVVLDAPNGIETIKVETASQMHDAVMMKVKNADIFIASAAVADYSPVTTESVKIKKTEDQTNLKLQKTKDILAAVAQLEQAPFLVGFAAETSDLETYARAKLSNKNLDMIAANWVGRAEGGFDSDENALEVYWNNGHKTLPLMTKSALAVELVALITTKFHEKNRIKNTG